MKRPRPIKRFRRCCTGCFLWAIFLVVMTGWWIGRQLSPVSNQRKMVLLTIPRGSSSADVAALLAKHDLIPDERIFLLYAKVSGRAANLKAGTFRLSPDMSAAEILARLGRAAEREDIPVTIPEGYTIRQIAEALKSKGIVGDEDAFVNLAKGPTDPFSAPFPLPHKGLEGYLFPDTYRFLPNVAPERVIQAMLDTFDREFYSSHQEEVKRSTHSLHEIVTIASLVEREAEVNQDRARIAGVIENRLRRKMRLEIDATLDYAHGHHLTRVLYKDLEINSPYNTYRHTGLPPGPIASPGLASLEAALHPERHDFLYYVSIAGGPHTFARTKAEHDRNVAKMRALRAQRR